MNTHRHDQDEDLRPEGELDRATAQRLSKLRSRPVDLSRLSARVEAQIPRPSRQAARVPFWSSALWQRPLQAVAASLLIVGLVVAVLLFSSSGPALASSERLLEVHRAIVTGNHAEHVVPVASIENANAVLSRQWRGAPQLPQVEDEQVMSCCVHRIGRQKLACVALEVDGQTISMAVADAKDVKMPHGQVVQRGGNSYRVQSAGGINMAMTLRNGRWACVMGPLSVDRLIDLLEELRW